MATMMSVYRQRQATPLQMALADCLGAAVTEEDTALIGLSIRSKKPVLVGLDNLASIIKPVAEGDESLTFEALYDTCLTLVDLRKMKDAGVDTPETVPQEAYRVDVDIGFSGAARIALALFADNPGDTRRAFRELYLHDSLFREALYAVVKDAMDKNLRAGGELVYRVVDSSATSYEPIDPQMTPGGPAWRFLEP